MPAGCIAIHGKDDKIVINAIAVLEQYRYNGVAKHLIQQVKQNYPKKKFIVATCEIHQKGFFEHLGFVVKKADKEHNRITMELKTV